MPRRASSTQPACGGRKPRGYQRICIPAAAAKVGHSVEGGRRLKSNALRWASGFRCFRKFRALRLQGLGCPLTSPLCGYVDQVMYSLFNTQLNETLRNTFAASSRRCAPTLTHHFSKVVEKPVPQAQRPRSCQISKRHPSTATPLSRP